MTEPRVTDLTQSPEYQATLAVAHAYRCSGCVPDIVVQLDTFGGTAVEVYHQDACTSDPNDDEASTARVVQQVAEELQVPLVLTHEQVG